MEADTVKNHRAQQGCGGGSPQASPPVPPATLLARCESSVQLLAQERRELRSCCEEWLRRLDNTLWTHIEVQSGLLSQSGITRPLQVGQQRLLDPAQEYDFLGSLTEHQHQQQGCAVDDADTVRCLVQVAGLPEPSQWRSPAAREGDSLDDSPRQDPVQDIGEADRHPWDIPEIPGAIHDEAKAKAVWVEQVQTIVSDKSAADNGSKHDRGESARSEAIVKESFLGHLDGDLEFHLAAEDHNMFDSVFSAMNHVSPLGGRNMEKEVSINRRRIEYVKSAGHNRSYQCVQSIFFQALCSAVILLNAIYLGQHAKWELQHSMKGSSIPEVFIYVDILFSVFFLFESTLRFAVAPWLWVFGPDWQWNMLDNVLIGFSVADLILSIKAGFGEGISDMSSARMLRLTRFVRIVRVVHSVRMFHSLRIVVLGIVDALKSMYWVLIVVAGIIWTFAIIFLVGAAEYVIEHGPDEPASVRLLYFFDDASTGMVTLFMAITGGLDWNDIFQAMLVLSWAYRAFLVLYIFIMTFAVLNVIIGAVAAAIHEISKNDKDILVESEILQIENTCKRLQKFFESADVDSSGMLSWEEFEAHMKSDDVKAHFQALELDVSQAKSLFWILDTDKNNNIAMQEFVTGCMRMKTQAKTLDIRMLFHQNEIAFDRLKASVERNHRAVESNHRAIENNLRNFQSLTARIDRISPETKEKRSSKIDHFIPAKSHNCPVTSNSHAAAGRDSTRIPVHVPDTCAGHRKLQANDSDIHVEAC